MSERMIATVIIEPHQLLREGLTSLISSYSYRVVSSVNCVFDIDESITGASQPLVILGAQTVSSALSATARVRKIWPTTKIVLLFDHLASPDLPGLLEAGLDGCIHLSTSREMLIGMLDLVMLQGVRVMVLPMPKQNGSLSHDWRTKPSRGKNDSDLANGYGPPDHNGHGPTDHSDVIFSSTFEQPPLVPAITRQLGGIRHLPPTPPACARAKLSNREWQILDGLVKGYANKVIARNCGITEATVKVHMKSILRKIQVGNRTQAAVWALENRCESADIDEGVQERVA